MGEHSNGEGIGVEPSDGPEAEWHVDFENEEANHLPHPDAEVQWYWHDTNVKLKCLWCSEETWVSLD